jgi:hydrogenase nickel incorporation protein HypB
MCATCGCDATDGGIQITRVGAEAFRPFTTNNGLLTPTTGHAHGPAHQKVVQVEQDILARNNQMARHNRHHFDEAGIFAINMVSSPGAGKTALLERTLRDLAGQLPFAVIEGDLQTTNDADRIAATGAPVVQINTGKGCHLDADMVHRALHQLQPPEQSVLFIENVGNLVCPAMFDLGEHARVALISVTEGTDKPLKYPDMFAGSQLCIINKMDLLTYTDFDTQLARQYCLQVNPNIAFIEVSVTKGYGLAEWYQWIKSQTVKAAAGATVS